VNLKSFRISGCLPLKASSRFRKKKHQTKHALKIISPVILYYSKGLSYIYIYHSRNVKATENTH
jgi:hypothetical protein